MQKESGCNRAQDEGNNDRRGRREGEREGIDIHPNCGPFQLFSRGCTYARKMQ